MKKCLKLLESYMIIMKGTLNYLVLLELMEKQVQQ